MRRQRPTIKARPVATERGYEERHAEFSNSRGVGGLLCVRDMDNGTVRVDVYRTDPQVVVKFDGIEKLITEITTTVDNWWNSWHRYSEEDELPPEHIAGLINFVHRHTGRRLDHMDGRWLPDAT